MTANSSRQIQLAGIPIGGGASVVVQSMTNTATRDAEATLAQISQLAEAGCEIVRVAVPDARSLGPLRKIVADSPLPIIADIHFDWRLAIGSMEAGVGGLRINPGNIGSQEKVFHILDCAAANGVVLRIGVNSGSLQRDVLARYGHPTPDALAESALDYARLFEKRGFYNFKLSLKSSSVPDTIASYRAIRRQCDYPLHIGVTEAGLPPAGIIRSAVGLGVLLAEGIGDTLRVSLTGDPVEEVHAAWHILTALGLRRRGPELISCPTCGRTEIDLAPMAQAVERALAGCRLPLRVAVMGCVVNGPGEAREADLGLAGGRDRGIIFRKGQVIRSVNGQDALLRAFLEELSALIEVKTETRD